MMTELPDPNSIPSLEDIPLPPPPPSSQQQQQAQVDDEQLKQQEEMLKRQMGFTSFNSTKGKKVPGNDRIGAIHVVKKRRYRQYMNRKGGFNRPLDKVA